MELNRYENVKKVIKLLDLKILRVLNQDDTNLEKLRTFTDMRNIYTKELNGIEKGKRTQDMFKKNHKI